MAPAVAEYGSASDEPTARIAFVEQFCSWSACRMKRTSSAFSSVGFGLYFTSAVLYIMFRKLPAKERSLSGYTYGKPIECLYANAARVGILAMRRTIWRRRTSG